MDNGGKAASLARLREGGFRVPPLFVCDSTWSERDVFRRIDEALPHVSFFAVRSSAHNEDSKEKSFAGHFYSAIGVSRRDVFTHVLKVIDSFRESFGSVIVQEFMVSDVSGVMFTEVGTEKNVVINATIGLCSAVVQGEACDEYVADRNGAVVRATVPAQKNIHVFESGCITSLVTSKESLTEARIEALVQLGMSIQTFLGFPQDIEWCFVKDGLYVLQARPITQDFHIATKEYFDSANIAESYSGIVLPLTCSFAQLVYEQVYKDLLRMSGVSVRMIGRYAYVFKNLLGFFYGRMYYNMNNWYYMAAFVPGYKRNKANFELMITSNIKEDITTPISPSLFLRIFYPLIVFLKVCVFGLTSRYFGFVVRRELCSLRALNFSSLDYDECVKIFYRLQHNLLRRWYVAVENDFFVMTYLGILKKLFNEASLQELIIFRSKATEQVRALAAVGRSAKMAGPLWSAIESNDVETFRSLLPGQPHVQKLIEAYLNDFGGRFANELKLESVGFDEDVTRLLSVLRAYSSYEPNAGVFRARVSLPFFKRVFASMILGKFKKYASRREEFRLLRSNTFAVARRLFRRMGELLYARGALQSADDVFYFRLEELLQVSSLQHNGLRHLVERRRRDYALYLTVQPPTYFATIDSALPPIQSAQESTGLSLQGRPASPGVVRGTVKIFRDFFMPSLIDFDILVTSHTDPGWTSLIALSKGLIIEHGGVLSHASIVARELGIPAVIGATGALSSLVDGQIVEINGSTGVITLLSS